MSRSYDAIELQILIDDLVAITRKEEAWYDDRAMRKALQQDRISMEKRIHAFVGTKHPKTTAPKR